MAWSASFLWAWGYVARLEVVGRWRGGSARSAFLRASILHVFSPSSFKPWNVFLCLCSRLRAITTFSRYQYPGDGRNFAHRLSTFSFLKFSSHSLLSLNTQQSQAQMQSESREASDGRTDKIEMEITPTEIIVTQLYKLGKTPQQVRTRANPAHYYSPNFNQMGKNTMLLGHRPVMPPPPWPSRERFPK